LNERVMVPADRSSTVVCSVGGTVSGMNVRTGIRLRKSLPGR